MSDKTLSLPILNNEPIPYLNTAPGESPFPDMIWVPGATFAMGSDGQYPDQAPVHQVRVDGFWMDRYPVTNDQFRKFVDETKHVTFADIPPRAKIIRVLFRRCCTQVHSCFVNHLAA